ncbi:MAG: hypothetical protein HWN65_12970 [Candidatus Helarchaeota archaeon]|nr:hypothetical protein [Candidatus Helarchaeota archaeon]
MKSRDEDTVAANVARILFLGEVLGKELTIGDLLEVHLNYQNGTVTFATVDPYTATMKLTDQENEETR